MIADHTTVIEVNGFLALTSDAVSAPARPRALSDSGVVYASCKESCDDADEASTALDSGSSDGDSAQQDRWSNSAGSEEAESLVWDSEDESQSEMSRCSSSKGSKLALAPGVFCSGMLPLQQCMVVPSHHTAISGEAPEAGRASRELTSVMIRNIPNNISRNGLVELFNSVGFCGCFDFLYLPIDFDSGANLGYAFLNLVTRADAVRFVNAFRGFSCWPGQSTSKKVTEVQWSREHQGLEEHVNRYRDTPLMHESVPEECRPMILHNGIQVPFPAPTRPVRRPRIRGAGCKRSNRRNGPKA